MQLETLFNRAGKFLIYILFLILLLEGASAIALKIYYSSYKNINYDLAVPEVMNELEIVQSQNIFFPTRWYTNKLNFNGKYVTTDKSGFRIDSNKTTKTKNIAFFGGSTMFSISTKQSETIPDQINFENFNSLNFGVGGYSSTVEIPTFIEAINKFQNIRIAVFYDGVNEFGRYIEMLQDKAPIDLFTYVGYYYKPGIVFSMNEAQLQNNQISYKSSFLWLCLRLKEKINAMIQPTNKTNLEDVATKIADQYLNNLEIIDIISKGKKIKPLFFWQPNIFTTKKELTNSELKIVSKDKTIIPKLAKLVHDKVMVDPRAKKLHIIDLTHSLDNIKGDIFYDWCHLNGEGNSAVANQMKIFIQLSL
jgi:hypothetical protein